MDTEKVTRTHMQHTYHMWLTRDTHTFSSSLHTVTLHVTVFNLMGGYQAFKAAYYPHLHRKVTPKHHTHCLNAEATVQACTTVHTKMLYTTILTAPSTMAAGDVQCRRGNK